MRMFWDWRSHLNGFSGLVFLTSSLPCVLALFKLHIRLNDVII